MKFIRTLVVWRTLERRGKSFTPASRVRMDESSRDIVSRRDETHPSRECAMFANHGDPYDPWNSVKKVTWECSET
jgi:hypothetical protein